MHCEDSSFGPTIPGRPEIPHITGSDRLAGGPTRRSRQVIQQSAGTPLAAVAAGERLRCRTRWFLVKPIELLVNIYEVSHHQPDSNSSGHQYRWYSQCTKADSAWGGMTGKASRSYGVSATPSHHIGVPNFCAH
ncbi:uncharacterized protein METZ01_LOCUS267112 [marine metagenome]|uniref:Uncharacterized protein n=1 Tax=marine metagenome TaxID=408172 RepID=A0A382JR02_9ZZZZ